MGHECLASVEEIGKKVTRVKPGDVIVIDPALACSECDQCRKGRPNTCLNLVFLGYPGQGEGCLSEYIVVPEMNCHFWKQSVPLEQAIMAEPISIGIYALKLLNNPEAKKIGIFGSGPIGLSVALVARQAGIKSIYMTDKINERLEAARRSGAIWAGNPDKSDIVEEIRAREPLLLDAVFECCGDQAAIDQAIEVLRPGGKLLIIGIPVAARISFDINKLRRKEISIQNVRRQSNCFQAALDLVGSSKLDLNFMITHKFHFEKIREAFELLAGYRDGVIKAVIQIP